MSICDLYPGQKGYIGKVQCSPKLAKRLLALGCIEGTEISLKKVAPFGDPIVVNFRGFDLAIRKKDARDIQIRRN